jgi:hypothetical protein
MNKVTIEITEKGWTLKAVVDGNEYKEIGVITPTGAIHKGDDIDDMEWMSEELYDALNSFFCYEVANALNEL